jgi:hypothetical protein
MTILPEDFYKNKYICGVQSKIPSTNSINEHPLSLYSGNWLLGVEI